MKSPLLLLFFMLFLPLAQGYGNCTPDACPSGYTDNGVTCGASTCFRNCTVSVCDGSTWTTVFTDTMYISDSEEDRLDDQTTAYNSSNAGKCYNFTYYSTDLSTLIINVDEGQTAVCDTEMIGGLFEEGKPSNPWYAGINADYLGLVNSSMLNYMYKAWRSWDTDDCSGECIDNAKVNVSLYCAPNTVACLGLYGTFCNTSCYNRKTMGYVYEGYFKINGSHDNTLYTDRGCGDAYMVSHAHYWPQFIVQAANTSIQNDDQSCDRPNEAPGVSNVNVYPLNATAGQDLVCNYTYTDPEEFSEQNSIYGWWRNGVNQNISAEQLGRGNLSPTDSWFCRVTPSDGLLFGDQSQSANNVTILSTVANATLYVEGNNTWNATGYYDAWDSVVFTSQLQAALDSCAADVQGYCNITLDFFSATNGTLNATTLTVYYENVSANTGIGLSGLKEFSHNATVRIYEFTIQNTGGQWLTNANWTFYPGNGDAVNSTIGINLSVGENASVYVAYNYSSVGLFTVTATARAAGLSSSQNISIEFPLQVRNLSAIYSSARERLFEFIIENTYGRLLSEVNFTVSRGDGSENSTYPLNLSAGESVSVYYYYNYSAVGNYTVNASATTGAYVSWENISVAVG